MSGPLTDIPNQLASALGTSYDNAALFLSCLILVSVAMACALVGRKMNLIATAVPMVAVMAFLVSIGWLPFWILLILAVVVALWLAANFRDVVTG